MNTFNAALLINLLGFTVGVALYAMLAFMIVRYRGQAESRGVNVLLFTTALLGILWNSVELVVSVGSDFGLRVPVPLLSAAAYAALGFLPSVVVHSAENEDGRSNWLTYGAYGLSVFAAVLHIRMAILGEMPPSDLALRAMSIGSIALAAGLLLFNFKQAMERKVVWVAALGVFAVSAFHLIGEKEGSSWVVELIAHQSSLPLALVILHQNYRFAFADLFLKRAISLILLALVAFGLYVWVAAPLLRYHETHDRNDAQAISLILTLWIATALVYPALHRAAVWLVDKVILHRVDYADVQMQVGQSLERLESQEDVLNHVCERLAAVLTSDNYGWERQEEGEAVKLFEFVRVESASARLIVPTAEAPHFLLRFEQFRGGRRLLSDETAMLESIALLAARRIDAIRVQDERYRQQFREQEFSKLATEAQLAALRAQVNPHFLFNALTTIGYLIQTAPEKAFQTLLHLTRLLRSVLSSNAEFCTLGEELALVRDYLDIERMRFEERLAVVIDIPEELEKVKIPSLILQPLVENAIKHGISENKAGGEVRITARSEHSNLILEVLDTGAARSTTKNANSNGTGLENTRRRLAAYYGEASSLRLEKLPSGGTRAVLTLPANRTSLASEKKRSRAIL
jgi:hypothetical protein